MSTPPTIDRAAAPVFWRTSQLKADGWTDRQIRAAVASGFLRRTRDGSFCAPETAADCIAASALRGRLTCVSELRRRGVFVLEHTALHVHVAPSAARLPRRLRRTRVHRCRLERAPHPQSMSVEIFDAVLQAILCQHPRAALATLDSALHHGLLRADDLDELFGALPRRLRFLRRLIDGRAESGPETLMRLILRSIGCRFDVQAEIAGVGRVDFLVDGWLIVECDSKAFHDKWEDQKKDRGRDQAAAAAGYATYRAVAEDIMWHSADVRAAVAGLVRSRGDAR